MTVRGEDSCTRGSSDSRDSRESLVNSQLPLAPCPQTNGSEAYRLSVLRSQGHRAELAAEGRDDKSFSFREYDPENPGSELMHLPVDTETLSHLPPAERLRLIGRQTVCLAVTLTCFGVAMMVTSFFFIRKHLNDSGFLLFFLVGLCALLPGVWKCYSIAGKYLGW